MKTRLPQALQKCLDSRFVEKAGPELLFVLQRRVQVCELQVLAVMRHLLEYSFHTSCDVQLETSSTKPWQKWGLREP